ncbi:ABC transporter C family member 3-like isoform X2 [Carex littledalei]|uniref:ABC transporter C family member 3-like isoform X2 n=1 Tax=Carex littledalei TaxID=544730 RepID=A0A833VYY8_9POAL|nr:ABC transporter C family member 3-like isoform X2 [Carex littledalei]
MVCHLSIISVYSLVLHLLSFKKHAIVDSNLWVFDFGSVFVGLLLSYAGFYGKRRNEDDDSVLQEPLIHGSCNNNIGTGNSTSSSSKNASLFTNAGFFSIFTFSWIGPLLSLVYRKTLDLEDIPMVDVKDSINGVLPIFKTNLQSQIGANGRVTPVKLAKSFSVHLLGASCFNRYLCIGVQYLGLCWAISDGLLCAVPKWYPTIIKKRLLVGTDIYCWQNY